jgi:hypothetical protein
MSLREYSEVCSLEEQGEVEGDERARASIADHAPIFEKHTITYSSAMAMRAL